MTPLRGMTNKKVRSTFIEVRSTEVIKTRSVEVIEAPERRSHRHVFFFFHRRSPRTPSCFMPR